MEVLNFYWCGQTYCLKISDISEILDNASVLQLPGIPQEFEGIFQLRGHIITLLNFTAFFNDHASITNGQIIVFAEPMQQFSVRVPGPVDARNVHFNEEHTSQDSNPIHGIIKATVTENSETYHLISPNQLLTFATEIVKRLEKKS